MHKHTLKQQISLNVGTNSPKTPPKRIYAACVLLKVGLLPAISESAHRELGAIHFGVNQWKVFISEVSPFQIRDDTRRSKHLKRGL